MKRVRWDCPNGHPGVLGPRRPARDNVVRYCLRCSEESGRLVVRTAPALERERATRSQDARAKQLKRRAREREAERRKHVLAVREVDGSKGEVDIPKTLAKMMRLPTLEPLARERCPYRHFQPPQVTLRRSRSKPYTSGHAGQFHWRFTVTAAADPERIEFEETLLHELVHLLVPHEWHGSRWRSVLVMAAREWWPEIETRPDGGQVWQLDQRIVSDAAASMVAPAQ